jgi:hypothetical protein
MSVFDFGFCCGWMDVGFVSVIGDWLPLAGRLELSVVEVELFIAIAWVLLLSFIVSESAEFVFVVVSLALPRVIWFVSLED